MQDKTKATVANAKRLYKREEAKEGELLTKLVITNQFKEEAKKEQLKSILKLRSPAELY